jgi:hypothetical protein
VHTANQFLHSIGKIAVGSSLDAAERSALQLALREDSRDYYHSSAVSLVDGIRSVPHGFYSWATVKLYYSVFYALRARLAIAGECLYYDQSKPRVICTDPGTYAVGQNGTTHKVVMKLFTQRFPGDLLLSQDIDGKPPLEWLMEKREEANYKVSRFTEPNPPHHMQSVAESGVRALLVSAEADSVYAFDPDHAIVAFPYMVIKDLKERLGRMNVRPSNALELKFLRKHAQDAAGKLPQLASVLS